MSNKPFYHLCQATLVLVVITFSVSCSKTPDVRLTLCQDVTKILLGNPGDIQWNEETIKMNGYNGMEVHVPFDIGGKTQSAVCYYNYEAEEPEATSFNDPASEYSTYPSKMVLKGKQIDQKTLAGTVNQAMKSQGIEAVHKAKEGIRQAADKIKKEIQK